MQEYYTSLDPKFAQSLVDIVASELNKNVNITDDHGVIVASFSKERISQVHEAAARMLKSGKITAFSVSAEDEKNLKGVRRGFNVPIIFGNKCVGVIGVTGDPELAAPYARLAVRFVEAALEANARQEQLVRALNEKKKLQSILLNKTISIQEEERKKISRELHDETSQALTSIIVGLRVLAEHSSVPADRESILQMRDVAVQTLEAVHNLALELRPVLLDDMGLVAAIQRYVDNYTRQYGIKIDVDFSNLGRERFLPEIEITLYRLVQEALTNIVRHARASEIRITLCKQRAKLFLSICDNGVGFEAANWPANNENIGLGIYGMRERVALLNGRFRLQSEIGKGTEITVEIPVRKKEKSRKYVEE
ncbi:MAG: sugar diacid recognition domain protein [Veillonellaceae bacterium]|jgi:two-component system sensor histidine kinase NreB|nr:sugar diacid recognition domain protein [Veillonellaceae bacterium]